MKHFYLFCLTILAVLCTMVGYAQEGITNDKTYHFPVTPSAQPWRYSTYGSEEQNMYHGTVSASIPIYTYEDPDFMIPVSLNYSSNGYKPNQQSSSVGLGWTLNTGGYITRKVVGIRDEMSSASNNVAVGFYNYWNHGYRIHIPGDIFQDFVYNSILSGTMGLFEIPDKNNSPQNPVMRYTETTPDQFSFNFLDHFGQFSLDGGMQTWVYNTNHPSGEYKVNVNKLWTSNEYDGQSNSCITITTGDGYKYEFNRQGSFGAIGVLDPEARYLRFENMGLPRSYWPLTKITAPNGRTVTFEYGDGDYSSSDNYERNYNFQWFSEYKNPDNSDDKEGPSDCLLTREWTRQLRKINIDNQIIIEFQYSDRTPEIQKFKVSSNSGTIPKMESLKKLSLIKVYDNIYGETIKECSLDHIYGKGNPVLLLSKVTPRGEDPYCFEYYDLDRSFPAHATVNLDHWGYYNNDRDAQDTYWGEDDADRILSPVVTVNSLNQENITSSLREPDFEAARLGMLSKITYPTKGFTTFEYEPHKYNLRLTRDLSYNNKNAPYLERTSADKIAGGVRISKITDYTSPTEYIVRKFSYNFVTESGVLSGCSGILLHFPRYSVPDYLSRGGFINNLKYSDDRYHIGYSEVKVEFSNGGFNVYHFSNYQENPDRGNNSPLIRDIYGNIPTDDKSTYQLYMDINSHYLERGQLMSVRKYDSTPKLKYKDEVISSHDQGWFIYTIKKARSVLYMYEEPVSSPSPKEREITEYLDNGTQYVTKHVLSYNALMQTTSNQVFRNNVKVRTTTWERPGGYSTSDRVLKAMQDSNYLSPVLREDVFNATGGLIKSTKYVYTLRDGNLNSTELILLSQIQEMKAGMTPVSNPDAANYVTTNTFLYNSLGRMRESIDNAGVSTCYLWGYNNLYPVAIGKNCTHSAANDAIGWRELPLGLTAAQGNALRNIAGAEFTIYSYRPYIGVNVITNPRGESIYYTYYRNKLSSISKQDRTSADPAARTYLKSFKHSADKKPIR